MKKNISDQKDPVHKTDPIKAQNFYVVKSGETLESISRDLMLENARCLYEYHNQRCSFLDIIPDNGRLRFLQKLCIPPPEEIVRMNFLIQQREEGIYKQFLNGKIPFNANAFSGDYKVIQTESDDGILKSEYAYSLHFRYIKEEKDQHIHFSMSNFKKDGEELEQKINNLAAAFVQIIYPITLMIDHSGSLLTVGTHKEIPEIIGEIEALKEYYQGKYASLHIDQLKDKMANSEVINASLKKLLPIQFLFSRFYQAHYNIQGMSVPYIDEFSWMAPASPIKMELVNNTLPEKDPQFIEVLQTGKSVDYRTVEELYNQDLEYDNLTNPHSKSLIASHSATYTLSAENFSVQKIKAGFHIQIADYEKSMTFDLEKLAG
ncbi:hypothetical protein QWZ06_10930 [Chryseobacterium tructae]|uniref:LysM domain-containing protein n=1 Tax=Chryseobacterium tructae TaxID=1037380 RepID=A0ABV7XYU0_9FLAO|nr:hypothetical protein [Chryseobacterium tructae]MDN3692756.1 hypothetical protein [Chryseobacterium tructae]